MKTTAYITVIMAVVLVASDVQAQGGLTPPGAPGETMKTLEQIEPRIDLATVAGSTAYHHIIQQPGSYYLGANLEVTTTTGGIYIDVPGVTLDLNGFEISRVSGSYGIYIYYAGDGATVRNGSITGFSSGVYSINGAEGCLFEKLAVSGCSSYGIVAGPSSRVSDCRAHNNPGTGILAYPGSSLSGCTAYNNQGTYGIQAGAGSTLSECTAAYNQGSYGIDAGVGSSLSECTAYSNQDKGIRAGDGSTLSGCTAHSNQGTGIQAYLGSSLSGCTAYSNQGDGIHASDGSMLNHCSARDNVYSGISVAENCSVDSSLATSNGGSGIYAGDSASIRGSAAFDNHGKYGIRTGTGSTVVQCTAEGNSGTGSSSYGISVDDNSSVIECTATGNSNTNAITTTLQGVGIDAGQECSIERCRVSGNSGDGIRVTSICNVKDNVCFKNGENGSAARNGAGIHVTGSDSVIDGNWVYGCDRGIDVGSYLNLIIHNRARSNGTNYDIVNNNRVGFIVSVPPSGAISGSTGGSGVGTTDPWANLSY